MTTITLRNRTRRPVVLHVPEVGTERHAIGASDRNPKTGRVGMRTVHKDLPKAITLWSRGSAGDVIAGLPETVEKSPEVVAAKARKDIDVERVESPAKVEPHAPSAAEEPAPQVLAAPPSLAHAEKE